MKISTLKILLKYCTKDQIRNADFSGANFSRADFSGADFRHANFSGADFGYADFRDADFRHADFSGADFSGANFSYANFRDANFGYANFSYANFGYANFRDANFGYANFSGADFSRADFSIIINENTFGLTINCPLEGSFIGYKKTGGYIIVLEICSDSKRSSATTYKCRASKTKTIRIENIDKTIADITKISSGYDSNFIYEIGKINEVNNFDDNRWNECSTGIHFFMSRQMAVNY